MLEVGDCQLSHFDAVEFHQFVHYLYILGDVLDDSVLWVDYNVTAAVDDSLDPFVHF